MHFNKTYLKKKNKQTNKQKKQKQKQKQKKVYNLQLTYVYLLIFFLVQEVNFLHSKLHCLVNIAFKIITLFSFLEVDFRLKILSAYLYQQHVTSFLEHPLRNLKESCCHFTTSQVLYSGGVFWRVFWTRWWSFFLRK